jgi:hypothetical protein
VFVTPLAPQCSQRQNLGTTAWGQRRQEGSSVTRRITSRLLLLVGRLSISVQQGKKKHQERIPRASKVIKHRQENKVFFLSSNCSRCTLVD